MMADLWRDTLRGRQGARGRQRRRPDGHLGGAAATEAGGHVTWVAAGQRWHDDSWVCPECGSHIERADADEPITAGETGASDDWCCTGCALRRPTPHWEVDGDAVVDPTGEQHPIALAAARPGQPGQRRDRARRRRPVRRRPGRRGAAAVRGRLDRRPLRPGRPRRPQHPAAAGQEPGRLAGGVRHGRGRADAAVDQLPRPRRPRHVAGCSTSTSRRCAAARC